MTGASLMSNAKNLTPHKWTVMVYMAGDRFLDNNGFADLKEMKNIGSTRIRRCKLFGVDAELTRRLRRAKFARQKIQVFKRRSISAFSNDHIVSHSGLKHESSNVWSSTDFRASVELDTEVVGVDEGQFFDNELIATWISSAKRY